MEHKSWTYLVEWESVLSMYSLFAIIEKLNYTVYLLATDDESMVSPMPRIFDEGATIQVWSRSE